MSCRPDDERYKDIIGKMLKLPLTDREIPVIADEYVDKEFGTGCVKITPAHDPNDFEVGKRHNLEEICIMNDDATINVPGKYFGMDRYEARKAMVEDLKEMGLLVKIVPHSHNVGTHDRCGTTVEPMVKPQWFVKMEEMAKPAVEALKSGRLKFVPESFGKTYLHWLEGIRDWCISRQLWWGHQIPAFYCDDCGELVVTKENSAVCPKCGKPVEIRFIKMLRNKFCFSFFYCINRRTGKWFHFYKPLFGYTRLYCCSTTVTSSYVMIVVLNFYKSALFFQIFYDGFSCFISIHARILLIFIHDFSIVCHHINNRQVMAQSNLKVIWIMGRCDLNTAGTKLLVYILICNNRDLAVG